VQAAKLKIVPSDGEGEIDGGIPPLIPPGTYQLMFHGWSTAMMFGKSPKVVLHFSVCDFGEHFGTKLSRWYNAARLTGKPGKSGKFKAGWHSDLFREYVSIVGVPARTDRIALSRYSGMIVMGQVQTVEEDRDGRKIPEPLRYSIVRKLVRKEI
jgi:hypothetical protein